MSVIRTNLMQFMKSTVLPDLVLGGLERARGISYPHGLIGRRNFPVPCPRRGGVLVIAAHPDDEVLGLGFTLMKHRTDGDEVTVAFTTNGGGNWRGDRSSQDALAARRYLEACESLGVIGISPQNILSLGFPDAGLRRYMPEAAKDIALLISAHRPKTLYVHAIEGGHRDHDVTSFLVQCVGPRLGVENLYEWAEYNREAPLARPLVNIRFPADPYVADHPFWRTSCT
jgi:LmbE family N-acetylglucosaminyl deacetylase